MAFSSLLYPLYERRLTRAIRAGGAVPRHIGVILDGNRRWARQAGESTATGHQKGADKITEVLEWSADAGAEVVTLWMLSTDNLSREPLELAALLDIICGAVETLAADGRWRLQHVGDASLLPPDAAARIARAVASTAAAGYLHVNVAVGYGGRHEIADAVRAYLRSGVAEGRSLEDVADSLTLGPTGASSRLNLQARPRPIHRVRRAGDVTWATYPCRRGITSGDRRDCLE